jgi:uncharacterized protein YndB with AHSA1/START domain
MTSQTDSANDIRITRLYDAPVAMVWNAWVDETQCAQWWGPRGFSITTASKDVRPGGSWEYVMHGPDGTNWPNFTRYHVVEQHARLVYDHGASSADAAPMFRVTATFRAVGGQTELVMIMTLPTPEAAQQTRGFVKAAGGNGTWDRLAEHLERQTSAREVFVINRTFEAPIERVFDAWTMPDQLAQWLPPAGLQMTCPHADIRTGGHAVLKMFNDSFAMYARSDYLDVSRPTRLVYRQSFTTDDGTITRHPGSPDWPLVMLTDVTFTSESPTHTRVTLRTSLPEAVTPAELAAFTAERGGMTQGWSGSFDVLEAMLAEAH